MNFELTGPLPSGTTVIEASAGTGKTFAIVGLATRYVAEGSIELPQLMLVTFSRVATQELRERMRQRLGSTARALRDPVAARRDSDPLIVLLATGSDGEVAQRRRRLLTALAEFDSATIATTHSFCQSMLDGLGIAGETDPDARFVEAVDDLVDDVVDDLYLRAYAGGGADAAPSPRDAREVAHAADRDRHAHLMPDDAPRDTEAGQRVLFGNAVRNEVERRKRIGGLRDFDDLQVLLRDALADPLHGPAACARVRSRYRVVLVDEFQDTDPVQWEILRRAFHGHVTLILVGDPKQAIYAFRGAEVLSYLEAVQLADHRLDLGTNWRSDAELVGALDQLYLGAALGHDGIVVRSVQAAHQGSRLPGRPPLRVRYLPRTGSGPLGKTGFPTVAALRQRVAADVAADIAHRLARGEQLLTADGARPLSAGDLAVLVRTRAHLDLVRDALDQAGVPSVLTGGTSVFLTAGATHWLRVLQAMEQPHRADRVRLAALTPLIGRTAAELDARGDDIVTELSGLLRELSRLFVAAGFAAVHERLAAQTRLESRLLAQESGERLVTDLRHIGQLLNQAALEQSFGLTALTRWLTERNADVSASTNADRNRRLDIDTAAVQLVTVHASKGLEFPVVYAPFGWDSPHNPKLGTLLLHAPDGRRLLDVGGRNGPGHRQRERSHDAEQAGEELRLLYVALTRAESQVIVWWAPSSATSGAPLHRLIFGRSAGAAQPARSVPVPSDGAVPGRLETWAGAAGGAIAVEAVPDEPPVMPRLSVAVEPNRALAVARFERQLDQLWRRTSYSALTAAAHDTPAVSSEPELAGTTDESDDVPDGTENPGGAPSPWSELPGGAAFGTLVHEILETLDVGAPDLAAEVAARCRAATAGRTSVVDADLLAAALLPALRTPLGIGTLADIGPRDRLAELDFEFALGGGDNPTATPVTLGRVATLLRRYLPAGDPLAPYADLLDQLDATPLRGYLVGSIDAALRTPDGRYMVVDYKTNRLARGPLTVLHYTPERMTAEMLQAHYPLQALIYNVALHRYLRWRLPGYQPARHLGGTLYLFLRGMIGPDTPEGCGVFRWHPPVELVTGLSDLLAGTPGGPGG